MSNYFTLNRYKKKKIQKGQKKHGIGSLVKVWDATPG